MGGGEGVKGNLKNEDLEQVGSLEPDPRYIRCCSAVCRPGHALRDALLGLLVVLALAVVVTVIFVVCFYVVPDEKKLLEEGFLPGNAEGVIRGPGQGNEITLNPSDKYALNDNSFVEDKSRNSPDFSTFSADQATTDSSFHNDGDSSERLADGASNIADSPRDEVHDDSFVEPRENTEEYPVAQENRHAPHHLGRPGERPILPGEQDPVEHGLFDISQIEDTIPGCKPVEIPMCISSVPWTQSGLPNIFNHSSSEEMFAILPHVRSALQESGCSALAPLYACSVLEPPCQNGVVLPPCQAFCVEVAQYCGPFVQPGSLPGIFDCERFPDSTDPSVCISAHQDQPVTDTFFDTETESSVTTQETFVHLKVDEQHTTPIETGIILSISENSVPRSASTEIPSNMVSTNTIFTASADSSGDFVPTTMMSLADRLKFAMSSSSNSQKSPTDRPLRNTNNSQSQTAPSVNRQKSTLTGSDDFSLASRLNTVTTERIRNNKVNRQSQNSLTEREQFQQSDITENAQTLDEPSSHSGVMSLAELLALSNKKRPASKPTNRQESTPRRRTPVTRNRFPDQVTDASTDRNHRVESTSRLKFRGRPQPTEANFFDYDEGERRIPVRTLDEVPKVRFNFPKRQPNNRPVTFRTTADPSLSTTEDSLQTTLPSSVEVGRTTRRRFIPKSKNNIPLSPTTPESSLSSVSSTTFRTVIETSADALSCPELQCIDGTCIAISQLNDGVIDCSDGSDEQDFGGLVT